ncbi:hypothetical protein, conserved, partial [Eimeria tenella]
GKLVGDWLALAAGLRGFDFACSGAAQLFASFCISPLNSNPVNPFDGSRDDLQCLLDAASGLASEGWEAASRRAYSLIRSFRVYEPNPRFLFSRVLAFNKEIEGLLQLLEEQQPKPQQRNEGSTLLSSSVSLKAFKRAKAANQLEALLADAKYCK